MSPQIRLHCHPEDDPDFISGVTLEMDLPIDGHIVEAVVSRLQARYPNVEIEVTPDGEMAVWHVYRDGRAMA